MNSQIETEITILASDILRVKGIWGEEEIKEWFQHETIWLGKDTYLYVRDNVERMAAIELH